jgi:hypothetical protein
VGSELIGTREEIKRVVKKMKKSTDVPIPDLGLPTKMTDDWIHSLPLASKERELLAHRFSYRMQHPLLLSFFLLLALDPRNYMSPTRCMVQEWYWITVELNIKLVYVPGRSTLGHG